MVDVKDNYFQRRRKICKDCEHSKPHRFGDRCMICGCFIVGKTWLRKYSCPIGKWQEEVIK